MRTFADFNAERAAYGIIRPFATNVCDVETGEVLGVYCSGLDPRMLPQDDNTAFVIKSGDRVFELPVRWRGMKVARHDLSIVDEIPQEVPAYASCDFDMLDDAYKIRWACVAVNDAEHEAIFDSNDFEPADDRPMALLWDDDLDDFVAKPTIGGFVTAMSEFGAAARGGAISAEALGKTMKDFLLTGSGERVVSKLKEDAEETAKLMDKTRAFKFRLGYGFKVLSNPIVKFDTTA